MWWVSCVIILRGPYSAFHTRPLIRSLLGSYSALGPYSALTLLLLGSYLAPTRLLLGSWLLLVSYFALTRLLRGSYLALTRLLLGPYSALTWLLLGSYVALAWLLLGVYWALTWLLLGPHSALYLALLGSYLALTRLLLGFYSALTRLLLGFYWALTWLLLGPHSALYLALLGSLLGSYLALTRLLLGSYSASTGLLLGSYSALTRLFTWLFSALTWLLLGSYSAFTRLLLGSSCVPVRSNRYNSFSGWKTDLTAFRHGSCRLHIVLFDRDISYLINVSHHEHDTYSLIIIPRSRFRSTINRILNKWTFSCTNKDRFITVSQTGSMESFQFHNFQFSILNLSRPSSKSTFSQPFKEKCISEVVKLGSIIIVRLSKLWKAFKKFFKSWCYIFGERAKFEIDHSWEWKGF